MKKVTPIPHVLKACFFDGYNIQEALEALQQAFPGAEGPQGSERRIYTIEITQNPNLPSSISFTSHGTFRIVKPGDYIAYNAFYGGMILPQSRFLELYENVDDEPKTDPLKHVADKKNMQC